MIAKIERSTRWNHVPACDYGSNRHIVLVTEPCSTLAQRSSSLCLSSCVYSTARRKYLPCLVQSFSAMALVIFAELSLTIVTSPATAKQFKQFNVKTVQAPTATSDILSSTAQYCYSLLENEWLALISLACDTNYYKCLFVILLCRLLELINYGLPNYFPIPTDWLNIVLLLLLWLLWLCSVALFTARTN